MGKKNEKHTELVKQAEYYKRLQRHYELELEIVKRSLSEHYLPYEDFMSLSYDGFCSLREKLFDVRSMLKMCAEKLREIKYQIKECSREFEKDENEELTELMRWFGEKFE
jgi:hypothetical protein